MSGEVERAAVAVMEARIKWGWTFGKRPKVMAIDHLLAEAALATRTPSDADRTAVVEECARVLALLDEATDHLAGALYSDAGPKLDAARKAAHDWWLAYDKSLRVSPEMDGVIRRATLNSFRHVETLSTPAGEDRP